MTALPREFIQNIVRAALAEDVGAGDITTEAAIPADQRAEACIVARESCVVAGLPLVEAVFAQIDRAVKVKLLVTEGDFVEKGTRVCVLNGPARGILTGERTALNFLQRLSGIATLTRQFVDEIEGTKARILDTRKTTPTLRVLEKYAVAVGGGTNHRMGLYDVVMIKDNHRVVLTPLGPKALGDAVAAARKNHPTTPVIVEADTLEQVEEALAAGADHVLLDNMTLGRITRSRRSRRRPRQDGGQRRRHAQHCPRHRPNRRRLHLRRRADPLRSRGGFFPRDV